jgi:nicotinate-nucleotide adenylyltransferase
MYRSTVSALLLNQVNRFLARHVTRGRHSHSIRTAQVAQSLAFRFGADWGRAYLAGLAHDVARDEPAERIHDLLRLYPGYPESPVPATEASVALQHGPAAAALLRSRFGVCDDSVLEAVAAHTVGRPGMGVLAKIVFVADYTEPGRTHVDDRLHRRLVGASLDQMVVRIIEHTWAFLEQRGSAPAQSTVQLYRELNNEALVGEAHTVHR